MSRLGKTPVIIPKGIKVEQEGRQIKVSGPLGNLHIDCKEGIKVKIDNSAGQVVVENEHSESRQHKEMHGTTRALIANMIEGVSNGYKKALEIYGTGYNVKEQGGKLILQLGFAHTVDFPVPKGVKVNIEVPATKGDETPAKFTLSGIDKCILGQFAAEVRKSKPPEPYKGKGIRYAGEYVKRKVGKAFTSGTTGA